MGSKIKSISIAKYVEAVQARENKIKQAPLKELPQKDSYLANRICNALHPSIQHVKVAKIVDQPGDAKSFYLVPNEDKGTKALAFFSAGQYLSVNLQIGKAVLTRPYSISSSPRQALNGEYVLTIKRVKDGLATNYILDNWTVGTEVDVSAPEGTFTYEPLRDAKTVVGLAGGSGITPFLSLANAIADGDEDANLVLLYGSRSEELILFKEEFDGIMARCDRVKVIHVLSDQNKEGYEHGFITAELIRKYAPEGDYSLFICGPQAMYNAVDKEIEKLSIRQKFVRHEVFGEYHNPERESDYPEGVRENCKITVIERGESVTIEGSCNDTLLVSLEKAGISAPSKCRSGICGWCRAKLVSGNVYVPRSVDGRRLADFDFGYIHPCCTFPIEDVVIEISKAK